MNSFTMKNDVLAPYEYSRNKNEIYVDFIHNTVL